MNIVRNGVEITLSTEELRLAYDEYRRDCIREDVMSKLDEAADVDNDVIAQIVCRAERYLDNNDQYFEGYWASIDSAINNVTKEESYEKI